MFRERIAERYERLGRNQKKIADFLTQEYRQAAFMNGSMLSRDLEVDPATVTGLARRLGYTGCRDLLREIQELVKSGSLRSCRLQLTLSPRCELTGHRDRNARSLAAVTAPCAWTTVLGQNGGAATACRGHLE
jgi:DNA-binding MurR/RpiR family transcriptional regulator